MFGAETVRRAADAASVAVHELAAVARGRQGFLVGRRRADAVRPRAGGGVDRADVDAVERAVDQRDDNGEEHGRDHRAVRRALRDGGRPRMHAHGTRAGGARRPYAVHGARARAADRGTGAGARAVRRRAQGPRAGRAPVRDVHGAVAARVPAGRAGAARVRGPDVRPAGRRHAADRVRLLAARQRRGRRAGGARGRRGRARAVHRGGAPRRAAGVRDGAVAHADRGRGGRRRGAVRRRHGVARARRPVRVRGRTGPAGRPGAVHHRVRRHRADGPLEQPGVRGPGHGAALRAARRRPRAARAPPRPVPPRRRAHHRVPVARGGLQPVRRRCRGGAVPLRLRHEVRGPMAARAVRAVRHLPRARGPGVRELRRERRRRGRRRRRRHRDPPQPAGRGLQRRRRGRGVAVQRHVSRLVRLPAVRPRPRRVFARRRQ